MIVLYNKDITPIISFQSSPVYYYAKNATLGGNVLSGADQKPFQGNANYDYMIWINPSIQKFTSDDVLNLIYHNKPVVSGYTNMPRIVKRWDEYSLKPTYMTISDIQSNNELFQVDYTTIDFISFKKGVMEQIKYPWFRPIYYRNKKVYDFDMEQENVDFCMQLKENGIPILIDPKIHVII